MAKESSKGNLKYWKIYLIGDSLTEFGFDDGGFVSQLAKTYIRKCDVINRGMSGYTSEYLQHMIPRLLEQDHRESCPIKIAAVLLGSNDANLKEESSRHVPLERYHQNLESIMKQLKEKNIETIILLSPPPIDNDAYDNHTRTNENRTTKLSKEHVAPYAHICKELATTNNLLFIDLFNEMLKEGNWKQYFKDGFHFSEKGNGFVFDKFVEVLDPIINNFPLVYPDYSDIVDLDSETLKEVLS